MAGNTGPNWIILENNLRYEPPIKTKLLIQVESSGYDDSVSYRRQRILINGVQVYSADAPRSYQVTRISQNQSTGAYNYESTNGYDVYGNVANATTMNTFLDTFNNRDILILNTNDEPFSNRDPFISNLINNFNAKLLYSPTWDFRCSYMLISIKGELNLYESVEPRYSDSIKTTIWIQ